MGAESYPALPLLKGGFGRDSALELLLETEIVERDKMEALYKEANELLAIFAASQHTAKGSNKDISK